MRPGMLHMQLQTLYRNIIFQTGRNARIVASIFTLAKLLAGSLGKGVYIGADRSREVELLRAMCSQLRGDPPVISPLLNSRA